MMPACLAMSCTVAACVSGMTAAVETSSLVMSSRSACSMSGSATSLSVMGSITPSSP